ncbi:unnamed protein product [Vitrella brassicaformis CCMP3155]|uniref:Uncharacterized protein n=1 Tax=Vitrella brassicaformis (strain CCMP3155) TaxID=1169540 RepID=A0A0G4F340_VITBC|nr:unnamed protein product [Vitrella brassicaformis CCMP3155]|eukprot:CEM06459.1 unnamed protein product [Vitrella brassicaformis CCMP3155]
MGGRLSVLEACPAPVDPLEALCEVPEPRRTSRRIFVPSAHLAEIVCDNKYRVAESEDDYCLISAASWSVVRGLGQPEHIEDEGEDLGVSGMMSRRSAGMLHHIMEGDDRFSIPARFGGLPFVPFLADAVGTQPQPSPTHTMARIIRRMTCRQPPVAHHSRRVLRELKGQQFAMARVKLFPDYLLVALSNSPTSPTLPSQLRTASGERTAGLGHLRHGGPA